jgi:hypothetical protein
MGALVARDTHDRSCQTCVASVIREMHSTTQRRAEGERLHRAQFQVWTGWYTPVSTG